MPSIDNFVGVFENFGKFLFTFFQDIKSLYIATFVFVLFLIYAILLALIHKVPGLGDSKTNKYGKVVAFAIALISTMGIYMVGKGANMEEVVTKVLPIYGVFGGAVLAVLFFAIIFFGFRRKDSSRWSLGMLGIGFAMAIVGYYLSMPQIQAIGWLLGSILLVIYIFTAGHDAVKEDKKD